jgi:hypothetical protein
MRHRAAHISVLMTCQHNDVHANTMTSVNMLADCLVTEGFCLAIRRLTRGEGSCGVAEDWNGSQHAHDGRVVRAVLS